MDCRIGTIYCIYSGSKKWVPKYQLRSKYNDSFKVTEKGACSGCVGEIKPCKYCGTMLNWLDHKPIEYRSGNYHRFPGRPRY